ncbi:MAG: MFS transporter, partial [Nocardia sp.]|nr:MFS transporter [Nocardia sp.]
VQYLQLILGYSPLRAAVAVLPMGAAIVGLSWLAPRFAARYGLRIPTAAGLAVLGIGLLLLSRHTPASGYPGLLWPLFVISIGLGFAAAPATAAIMADTAVEHHGVAAAVNDAAREIGAAIGIAVAGTVLAGGYRDTVGPVLSRLPEPVRDTVAHSPAATAQLAERAGPQAEPLLELARSGFVEGMHQTGLTLAVISLAAAVVLGILAPGRTAPAVRELR